MKLSPTLSAFAILMIGAAYCMSTYADAQGYDAHTTFSATYTVPTNRELASYATFKLKNIKFVRNNEAVSAKYSMPSELIGGSSSEIEMTGKLTLHAAFFSMSGKNVEASCSELGKDSYVCLLKFKKDGIRVQENSDYFKKAFADSNEAAQRILVAKNFGADPVGILRIEKN